MFWLILFLTIVLVLDALFLVLLILVQLPKKEAGLGQAFGAGATDAPFGAGSGNALTKMTKYATGVFLVLTLVISIMNVHSSGNASGLQERMNKLNKGSQPSVLPGATTNTISATPEVPALSTNAIPKAPISTSAVNSTTTTSAIPVAPTTPSAPATNAPK
jgi:protein translocase SecG subunit